MGVRPDHRPVAFFDVDETLLADKSMVSFWRHWRTVWQGAGATGDRDGELRTAGADRCALNRGVPELEGPPPPAYRLLGSVEGAPERRPHPRVERLQLEDGSVGRGERRPTWREFGCLALLGPGGGQVLGDGEQTGPLGAHLDLRDVPAPARPRQQSGQHALHGEDTGGGGGVVDGETARGAVATAVHRHDADGRLGGGFVGCRLTPGGAGADLAHVAPGDGEPSSRAAVGPGAEQS